MNQDLKVIKKLYGEKFMHLCKKIFPTLLEVNGLLSKIVIENFNPNKSLYDDLLNQNKVVDFRNYIYSKIDIKTNTKKSLKTPFQLMDEAGYKLYECKTENDIQQFKKYYEKDEELCTFNQYKSNTHYVFFALSKDLDAIKRKNFSFPKRQDKYGTSVISIQFTREINGNILSIKNRYNHKVNNPDATFSNNLENIIEGLTSSFEKYYNLKIDKKTNSKFELDNYVLASDNRYYKYNYKINNNYYCPNNIIVNEFFIYRYPSEKYILMDYFLLDLENKKLFLKDPNIKDSFINEFDDIKKIEIQKNVSSKTIFIYKDDNLIIIEIDLNNKIVGYFNKKVEEIKDYFLYKDDSLKIFICPNLNIIGHNFCLNNNSLVEFHAELTSVGNNFLYYNNSLKHFNQDSLIQTGECFFKHNDNFSKKNKVKIK